MKKIVFTIVLLFLPPLAQASSESTALGEERIEPVFYPKFSFIGDYSVGKKFIGLDHDNFKYDMPDAWGGGFAFEAGLYRYFNAGGILAFRIPLELNKKDEPIITRLLLFAKPFYPIGSNFSIFSRIGGGLMSSLYGNEAGYLMASNSQASSREFFSVYDTRKVSFGAMETPFGATALASVGLEFFPTSRLGLAVEAGVRADFSWIIGKTRHAHNPEEPSAVPGSKTTISYMTFDFPISVTLHTIF